MTHPALLFDLDGTLLDTDEIHREIFADMLRPTGVEVTKAFYLANIHGRLNAEMFTELMPDAGDPQKLSEDKEAEFRRRLPRPYPAMPGAERLIREAQVAGWPMAVVTNAPRLNAEAMLEAIGLRDVFDVIIIGEECPRGKPHPDPYLEAMRELGVKPSMSVAFEDSPSGMRAASASGAYSVGIRSSLDDAALRAVGAHMTYTDFTDITLKELRTHLRETQA